MESLLQAYRILGLPENAKLEQAENAYFLFMRREKNRQNKLTVTSPVDQEEHSFAEITAAYQYIKQHQLALHIESNFPKEKEKSLHRRKFEHFWEYYKVHTFFAILGVILLGMIVQGILVAQREKAIEAAKPPIDVSISIFGTFRFTSIYPDLTSAKLAIQQMVTGWQRVEMNYVYAPIDGKDSYDVAFQQKSVLSLATEKPDMYITDKDNFYRLSYQGVFHPLTDIESELIALFGKNRLLYNQSNESSEQILYGIDISNSSIFAGIAIDDKPKIISVRIDAQHIDKSRSLLLQLAQELKK